MSLNTATTMVLAGFFPQGNTVVIAAASTAPTPAQVPTTDSTTAANYEIQNTGTIWVYVGAAPTSAGATANAVIPLSGTPAMGYPIPPGCDKTITLGPNYYFTAITKAGQGPCDIYITPGTGL